MRRRTYSPTKRHTITFSARRHISSVFGGRSNVTANTIATLTTISSRMKPSTNLAAVEFVTSG